MRDLEIWRRLHAGTATPADLDAIARLTFARRGPYMPAVLPLADAGDPALRAAALDVLAGCRGVPALRAIVARLADDDAAVRTAAIAALRATARDAPYRYVHALFHPREDVRRASLEGELSLSLGKLAIYLRADPACRACRDCAVAGSLLPVAPGAHAAGHVSAGSVDLVADTAGRSADDARAGAAPRADIVDAQFGASGDRRARSGARCDLLSTPAAAIVTAASETPAFAQRIRPFLEIATPRKGRAQPRRAAVVSVRTPETRAADTDALNVRCCDHDRARAARDRFPRLTRRCVEAAVLALRANAAGAPTRWQSCGCSSAGTHARFALAAAVRPLPGSGLRCSRPRSASISIVNHGRERPRLARDLV
jgi:hypothetical protein